MPEFSERFRLDLADTLPGDVEFSSYFFERARVAVAEAEAQEAAQ